MQTIITVRCPLPGFEAVEIDYNLMASEKQIDLWTKSLGTLGADSIVADVRGWPKSHGEDAFGADSPMAFRIWACQRGMQDAVKAFVADPN
jgi:hypothetical protein